MKARNKMAAMLLSLGIIMNAHAERTFKSDALATSAGVLTITFIGHGTLIFEFLDKTFHVDPYGKLADYATLPKADAVFITHDHGDHLDPAALQAFRKPGTLVVMSEACRGKLDGTVMTNGQASVFLDVPVESVPAYNLVHIRPTGQPFHPRGAGCGFVFTFGDKRVYVAGDTENVPEMKALKNIDVAFLPMNLPYTMTPEMVADAARAFRPKILYPYHYGETVPAHLKKLLQDEPGIEVRIRDLR